MSLVCEKTCATVPHHHAFQVEICTTTLYVKLALDEARRSREKDKLVAEAAATHRRKRDGAGSWPYSEGETNEDYVDLSETAPEIGLVDREPPPKPRLNGNSTRRQTSTAGTRTGVRDRADDLAEIDEGGARGIVQERMITEFYPGAFMLEREKESAL